MQNKSIDIYDCIMDANRKRLYIPKEKIERNSLQTQAISDCDKLNMFIETAMNHNLISAGLCDEWSKKVKDVKIFPICAITGDGINEVLIELSNMLDKIEKTPLYEEQQFESHILYKFKKEEPFKIINDNGVWVISGEQIEKLYRMTRFTTDEAALRFSNKLKHMGVDEKLRSLGAKDGDTIRILDIEFEYKEN